MVLFFYRTRVRSYWECLSLTHSLTNSLCRFGRLSFCSDFEHKVSRFGQDFEVDVQANFLKLKFGQYIAADAWLGL